VTFLFLTANRANLLYDIEAQVRGVGAVRDKYSFFTISP